MRRVLLFIVFFIAVFLSVDSSSVFAASNPSYYDWSSTTERVYSKVLGATTTATGSSANFSQFTSYVLGGNLTPANPLYFIKPFQENVVLAFTFDPVKKEEVRIAIAGERLDEMKKIADSNQANGVSVAASGYENVMTQVASELEVLKKQKKDISSLTKQLEEETAKQNIVLEQVSVQVPDTAKASVADAIKANWDGTDTVADLAGRPAVPPDLVDRIQSFKAQGLLTSEEAAKLISVKTRSEARLEMQKYVKEGVIPESDFLRMNENVKALYPQDFYKQHEVKRFQELQQLESQKPDQTTLTKIEDFSKTYKPGDVVPSEIRKYWVPVIRLEELQNTLRPDLIDPNLLKNNKGDVRKFNELVERFKPRPEDMAYVQNYIKQNNADVNSLPPEYQRMYNLARSYGAQCGSGHHWVPEPSTTSGGYCVPDGSNSTTDLPKTEDFAKGRSCNGQVVGAKGPGGACRAYPSDCIPPGWTNVGSCTNTLPVTPGSGSGTSRSISCPSNAHFVPISYSAEGGYCIPNYTQISTVQTGNQTGQFETTCQAGYRRDFPGGPCLPETSITSFTRGYLPQLSLTPGGPIYPSAGRCGSGNHWVPEPINPNGGYCAPDSYTYQSGGGGQQVMPGNGLPKTDMGNCRTPGECYDYCKTNPTTPSCSGFNPSQPRPGDTSTPSREAQEAACRSGGGTCTGWNNGACSCENYKSPGGGSSRESQEAACKSGGGTCTSWVNGACSCTGYKTNTGSPGTPVCQLYCPSGQYADNGSCSCRRTSDYPSACSPPSAGCGTEKYWDTASCYCKNSGSSGSGGAGGVSRESQEAACKSGGGTCVSWNNGACGCERYTAPTTTSSPPSGYGSCGSGMKWNGSYCVSEASPTNFTQQEDPATACTRGGGCTWTGSSCNCPSQSSQPTTPPPSSSSPPQAAPPPSSGGSCSGDQHWVPEPTNPNGGYCAGN